MIIYMYTHPIGEPDNERGQIMDKHTCIGCMILIGVDSTMHLIQCHYYSKNVCVCVCVCVSVCGWVCVCVCKLIDICNQSEGPQIHCHMEWSLCAHFHKPMSMSLIIYTNMYCQCVPLQLPSSSHWERHRDTRSASCESVSVSVWVCMSVHIWVSVSKCTRVHVCAYMYYIVCTL